MATPTIQLVNFELVSDLMATQRRDFVLDDATLVDPTVTTAIVDGEWLTLNSSYKLIRASDITQAAGTVASAPGCYIAAPAFWEKGRYDIQALAEKKGPIVFNGYYEARTRIFDASLGATITAVGQPLKIAVVADAGGKKYSGLMAHSGTADSDHTAALVSKLPAADGGWLRFIVKCGGRF